MSATCACVNPSKTKLGYVAADSSRGNRPHSTLAESTTAEVQEKGSSFDWFFF